MERFANRLRPGEVGCLAPGHFHFEDTAIRRSGRPDARITLRSADVARPATLRGRFWVADSANYWTFKNINFDGRSKSHLPSPTVNGDYSVWRGNDVTNHSSGLTTDAGAGICFNLGSLAVWGRAAGTLIERNRIHDCGRPSNHNHGIYLVATSGKTVIRDNWIWGNGDRAIQLYPDADDVTIRNNVIDGNGQGIIFSGDHGAASDRNTVTRNIISNSRLRWNVEHWWPPGNPIGVGNALVRNCLWASNSAAGGMYRQRGGVDIPVGFTPHANLVAKPLFTDAGAGHFAQLRGSGCTGYGPRHAFREDPPRRRGKERTRERR